MVAEPLILLLVVVLLYASFLLWYGGRSTPLSKDEVEALIARIWHSSGKQVEQEEEPALLTEFRVLAGSDDGREYYMVNLLKFREQAAYPAGSPYSDDVQAANGRYNRAIIPLLFKHGGHPVFDSLVEGRFLHPDDAEDWDHVAMVRYRSRRDMLEMAAEIAARGVDIHKWAALEKTQVFPVKPLVSLVFVRTGVAAVLVAIALLAHIALNGGTVY